jgi:hypothetical protein
LCAQRVGLWSRPRGVTRCRSADELLRQLPLLFEDAHALATLLEHEEYACGVELDVQPDSVSLGTKALQLRLGGPTPIAANAREWEALFDTKADIRCRHAIWPVVNGWRHHGVFQRGNDDRALCGPNGSRSGGSNFGAPFPSKSPYVFETKRRRQL